MSAERSRSTWCFQKNSFQKAEPFFIRHRTYQGVAITKAPERIANRLPRAISQTGANSNNGRNPFASTATPSKAPVSHPRLGDVPNKASSVAAATAAAIGRSGTAAKLAASQPAEPPRMTVEVNATRNENSRRKTSKKNARNARLISATGKRAAHSSRSPTRFAAAVVQ